MTGRAQLLLIMGFSAIFLVVSLNFATVGRRTEENSLKYYSFASAREIASSGMNVALEKIYEQQSWSGTISQNFAGGSYAVSAYEVEISPGTLQKTVTSIGSFGAVSETSVVTLQRLANESLAKYAYFLQRPMDTWESQPQRSVLWYWTSWHGGDTISGPMHNGTYMFTTNGDPVFWGKVTCGLDVFPFADNPQFNGGLRVGTGDIEQKWTDTAAIRVSAQSGGLVISDTMGRFTDTRLAFNSDGTVTYATRLDTGTYSSSWPIQTTDAYGNTTVVRPGPEAFTPDGTTALTTYAPNGLILARNGNIHVQGTVNGRVTVVANTTRSPSSVAAERSGNVLIDNDLVYADDPRTNPSSTNAFGSISFFDSWIMKNDGAGNLTDITVDGAFFNITGEMRTPYGSYSAGFSSSTLPVLHMLGGSFSNRRNDFYSPWFSPSSGVTFPNGYPVLSSVGYQKRLSADARFITAPPPFYPTAPGTYRIVSWYE